MNEFVRINDLQIPPGFYFVVRPLQPPEMSPSSSPNLVIEITKQIRKLKRKLKKTHITKRNIVN